MQQQDIEFIVCKTLTALGFDIREPQKIQADLLYLREKRLNEEAIAGMTMRMKFAILTTVLTALVIALISAVWLGVKQAIRLDL